MKTLHGLPLRHSISTLLTIVLILLLIGCASPRKYTVHLKPHPEGAQGPSTSSVVGVLPFEDARPSKETVGKRVHSDGTEKPIFLDSPSPSEDVTYILRRGLVARNVRVVELSSWKPDPKHLKDLPEEINIAIAGRIEALEVEAKSSLLKTTVKYRVRVSARVGLKEQGTVVSQAVEIRPEETFTSFDLEKIEEQLNAALAQALNRLLESIFSQSLEAQSTGRG
ncbi:MAG: hypothetical protein JSU72_03975 [Deltaproteobacteria bacterium]|nr:MAG: hypothetical protein JSU72_03975 [Deltaproteobacteria bacterium]